MKTIPTLLNDLRTLDIQLWLEDGQLRYNAPKGALTPELRDELRTRKADLIAFLQQAAGTSANKQELIHPAPSAQEYPLSSSQQRFWLLHQLAPDARGYTIPIALRLDGPLQPELLDRSLAEVIRRHAILRATFPLINGLPVQRILPAQPVTIARRDLRYLPGAEQQQAIQQAIANAMQTPFDLEHSPLLQMTLLDLGNSAYVVLLMLHHIIADGWSSSVLMGELAVLYRAFAEDRPSPLPPLPIQYNDFAVWEQHTLRGDALARHLEYWEQTLRDAPPMLDLPTDHTRQDVRTSRGARLTIELPPPQVAVLRTLCQQQNVTLFMTLLTALQCLLFQWTRQSDIVVGTVAAHRTRPELERLIGCFINFLALRSSVQAEQTGLELLQQVKTTVLEAYAHEDCPFEKVVERVHPSRQRDDQPLYNVALLLQNYPQPPEFHPAISAALLPVEMPFALLDLRFVAYESADRIRLECEYRTDLFELETITQVLASYRAILDALAAHPEESLAQFNVVPALQQQARLARQREHPQTLAIAATFTAEPIRATLEFWMDQLGLPTQIVFAPYHQVFQELLRPDSTLSANRDGINILLLRFEDWERTGERRYEGQPEAVATTLEQTLQEFISALRTSLTRAATPTLIALCPASPNVAADPERYARQQRLEAWLVTELKALSGVYPITSASIAELYPVPTIYDPYGEQSGKIPFTPEYFTALGSMLTRTIHALQRAPYKVIVLDCDGTLWQGVCGEDGPLGVQFPEPYLALQWFMVRQMEAGMLVCLCSKNAENDVREVFQQRPEMPLKWEHIIAQRINWQPKSANLRSLAAELQLGLDSFIMVDDNPLECGEIQMNCPEVLTLQLPSDASQIPQFLSHYWAFDCMSVTAEDARRTELYRQNLERERVRAAAVTFDDFLANLGLQVQITQMTAGHIPRVAQLTQRTNQFNMTTKRRTEQDIQAALDAGRLEGLVVEVSDRFGDYGLVGIILFEIRADALWVDTWLLSCRTLGRRVEHQMLAYLQLVARQRGLRRVDVPFTPTAKNQPAFDFLQAVSASGGRQGAHNGLFTFPTEH